MKIQSFSVALLAVGLSVSSTMLGGCAADASDDTNAQDESVDENLKVAFSIRIPLIDDDGGVFLSKSNAKLKAKGVAPVNDTAALKSANDYAKVTKEMNARFKKAGLDEPYFSEPNLTSLAIPGPLSICYSGPTAKITKTAGPIFESLRYSEHSIESIKMKGSVLVVEVDDGFGDITTMNIPKCKS